MIKTYKELKQIETFEERFRYLKMNGTVGEDTFGFDRYVNQIFYRSQQWKSVRNIVIVRDNGCDLGIEGREIYSRLCIHHMNPITFDDIVGLNKIVLDPEYLICTTHETHNAIHFGDENHLVKAPVERYRNDTCPWKRAL